MLNSASGRNLEEDDFSDVNVVISTTGVVGDLSVHNEPIGVTPVMAHMAMLPIAVAMQPIDAAATVLYDNTNRCASANCNNSGHTQYSWVRRGCGIYGPIWRYIALIHCLCFCAPFLCSGSGCLPS